MFEREWREATDMKPATLWLAVVLATAALLRFWHLGHGLPGAGADEADLVARVVAMMRAGDLHPQVFDQPRRGPP